MLKKVDSFRLQPIISLYNKRPNIVSYEILTNLKNIDIELESYFKQLTILEYRNLFLYQASLCSKMSGKFHVNAPCELFLERFVSNSLLNRLNAFKCHNLEIEIQDPERVLNCNIDELYSLKSEIIQIRSTGASIWIDDINTEHFELAFELGLDGVKLDKSCFWDVSDFESLHRLFKRRDISLIIEGVQDIEHFKKALETPQIYYQGFFWPDVNIDLNGTFKT